MWQVKTKLALLASAAVLSGCMGSEDTSGDFVSRFMSKEPKLAVGETKAVQKQQGERSALIDELQSRRSVLPAASTYSQVARAVLETNSSPARAELRAARLRAEAASKNWLPTIGPNISLTSLGEFVANLVIDQVLFDNGRKKAEREFAKADVEVAAVVLTEDTNDRVYQALDLYLKAEEGRETARLSERALQDMAHFEWIMNERVNGGVSDPADLNVTRQKLSEMRATLAGAQEQTQTALAELRAMASGDVSAISGASDFGLPTGKALSVVKAEAEQTRSIAQITMERAGLLPGVKATATVGKNGGAALQTTGGQLGFGTKANLEAIEAAKEAASMTLQRANETALRKQNANEQRLSALQRQIAEAEALTQGARENLNLFQTQYEAGQRQVMDVVGVYETFVRQQQSQTKLKYDAARIKLQMARDYGILADGDKI